MSVHANSGFGGSGLDEEVPVCIPLPGFERSFTQCIGSLAGVHVADHAETMKRWSGRL